MIADASRQATSGEGGFALTAASIAEAVGGKLIGDPTVEEGGAGGGHPIREFLERSQQTFDEWQKKVDERIRSTVESLSPLSGLEKEVRALSQRLADLEKRLEERD